jgi:molybdopterin biosynthesis enzyme
VAERSARIGVEKVAMKPGKPLVFGIIGSKPNGIFAPDK